MDKFAEEVWSATGVIFNISSGNYDFLMITRVVLRGWVFGVSYSVNVEEKEGEEGQKGVIIIQFFSFCNTAHLSCCSKPLIQAKLSPSF